jgi:hypothetical protein
VRLLLIHVHVLSCLCTAALRCAVQCSGHR